MKTRLMIAAFFIVFMPQTYSAPQYVIIKKRLIWGWKLKHIDKPNDSRKWYYNAANDTYYSMELQFGTPLRIK